MGNLVSTEKLSPSARKISDAVSGVVVTLLLVAVCLYAGFRGRYAYHHDPASITKFEQKETVKYPAVTTCPLRSGGILQPLDCSLQFQEDTFSSCMFSVKPISVFYDGMNRNCYTFNSDGSLVSKTPNDEFSVKLSVNTTIPTTDEEPVLGALVFLHKWDQDPTLSATSAFLADSLKLTNVWLKINEYEDIDGKETRIYSANKVSSATIVSTLVDNLVCLNFVFPESGIYETVQYYPYTVHNWIGEVGGFACLLTFIHFVIIAFVNLVLRKLKPLSEETEKDNNNVAGLQLGDPQL